MNYTLKDVLKDVVVLPYDDSTMTTLDEAIRSYKQDSSDTFIVMDEMAECFLAGKFIPSFAKHMNSSLVDSESMLRLPAYILQRIALYKAYLIVNESEDELEQAILASVLMNFLVLYKSDFCILPLPEIVSSFYKYHISLYLAKKDKIQVCSSPSLIDKVAKSSFTGDSMSEADLKSIKMMAKESFLYRSKKILDSKDVKGITDPFARVYIALKQYIESADYLYYNMPYQTLLKWIFEDESFNFSMHKKLRTIIDTLRPYNNQFEGCYTTSSVLLRLIQGAEVNRSDILMEKKFTLEEFSVYLYYELLIESIIEKITE